MSCHGHAHSTFPYLSAITHGKPAVRGLRYPVEMLLDLLSSGMTPDEILADYADLEREDLLAVFAFAAQLSRVKRMEPMYPVDRHFPGK